MWEVMFIYDDYDSVDTIVVNACFFLILVLLSTRPANGCIYKVREHEINGFEKLPGSTSSSFCNVSMQRACHMFKNALFSPPSFPPFTF